MSRFWSRTTVLLLAGLLTLASMVLLVYSVAFFVTSPPGSSSVLWGGTGIISLLTLVLLISLIIAVLDAAQVGVDSAGTYTTALLATSFALPMVAAAFVTAFSIAPLGSEPGWQWVPSMALVLGSAAALLAWLIMALLCRRFAAADRANTGAFGEIQTRLASLDARLEGIPAVESDRAAAALKEAQVHAEFAKGELKSEGLRWMLATGYLSLWARIYRAEEALIEVEARSAVIRAALETELRLEGSNINNAAQLLAKLRLAVKVLSDSAAEYLDTPNTPTGAASAISAGATATATQVGVPAAFHSAADAASTAQQAVAQLAADVAAADSAIAKSLAATKIAAVLGSADGAVTTARAMVETAIAGMQRATQSAAEAVRTATESAESVQRAALSAASEDGNVALAQTAAGKAAADAKAAAESVVAAAKVIADSAAALQQASAAANGDGRAVADAAAAVDSAAVAAKKAADSATTAQQATDGAAAEWIKAVRTAVTTSAARVEARAVVRQVVQAVDEYRSNMWAGLVRVRNRLMGTVILTGLTVYVVVALAVLAGAPAQSVKGATALYLVGAIVGLFNRLYSEAKADSAVEDYGLAMARLIHIPLLSGLAALGGVLIVTMLPSVANSAAISPRVSGTPVPVVTATPASGTARLSNGATLQLAELPLQAAAATPTAQPGPAGGNGGAVAAGPVVPTGVPQPMEIFDLARYPFGIIVAAIFGLAPGLFLNRLQQLTEQYKSNLQSSEGPSSAN